MEPHWKLNWRRDRRKTVYLLPNLFTAASLFCAFASIVNSASGNFQLACYLVLASAVLDALDGPVARLTRSSSNFGLQFDSLADLVAFGVAPAFLMYTKLERIDDALELSKWAPNLALGACSLFAVCGAIRLARFNVQAVVEERKHFTGLPIPGAAAVVIAAFLFIETYLRETRALHGGILVLMMAMSGLMVSTVPFPKLAVVLKGAHNNPNVLITIVFVFALVLILWQHLPAILLGSVVIYLGATGVAYARGWQRQPSTPAPATARDAQT